MVGNGAGGLLLVLGVLFLFLSTRVAFWVAVGIPVAFMATFAVMLAMGQSINMISLFGLIMALGIVVDDAIVIGEHAEYLQKRRGLPIDQAAAVAATRMGPPVVSAMLTTVVAFLPLFTVKGIWRIAATRPSPAGSGAGSITDSVFSGKNISAVSLRFHCAGGWPPWRWRLRC